MTSHRILCLYLVIFTMLLTLFIWHTSASRESKISSLSPLHMNHTNKGQLYVTDKRGPFSCEFLNKANITLVINAAIELRDPWDLSGTYPLDQCPIMLQIRYVRLDLRDSHSQDLSAAIKKTNPLIDKEIFAGGNVLIHCAAGISRSVAIAMAFLIYSEHLTPSEALARIRQVRPQAKPNRHFYQQLQEKAQNERMK